MAHEVPLRAAHQVSTRTNPTPPIPFHPPVPPVYHGQDGIIVFRPTSEAFAIWMDGKWSLSTKDHWAENFANAIPPLRRGQWTVIPYMIPLSGPQKNQGISMTIDRDAILRAFDHLDQLQGQLRLFES